MVALCKARNLQVPQKPTLKQLYGLPGMQLPFKCNICPEAFVQQRQKHFMIKMTISVAKQRVYVEIFFEQRRSVTITTGQPMVETDQFLTRLIFGLD